MKEKITGFSAMDLDCNGPVVTPCLGTSHRFCPVDETCTIHIIKMGNSYMNSQDELQSKAIH